MTGRMELLLDDIIKHLRYLEGFLKDSDEEEAVKVTLAKARELKSIIEECQKIVDGVLDIIAESRKTLEKMGNNIEALKDLEKKGRRK